MTKKLDRMERIQLLEDQRRALLNACAVLHCAAHSATDDIVDRDQIADVMLLTSKMVDDVAARLKELMEQV